MYFYPKMLQQNVKTRGALMAGAAALIKVTNVCGSDTRCAFWRKD